MYMRGDHSWAAGAVLLLVFSATPAPAFAQVNVEVMQGVQFDFLAPGARSLGMGGAFVAVADDATAALANPAGLSALRRKEVSFELRRRTHTVPFVLGGRLSGSPTGTGIDTVATPSIADSSSSEGGIAFLSFVFASPDRRWTAAAYRHEIVRFSTSLTTDGAFEGTSRYFPATGALGLDITNYGFAGSYKWQACSDVSGARMCEDRLAVGGGLSIYQYEIDSLTTRYDFPNITGAGSFYGAPQYTVIVNQQTVDGDGTSVGLNVGVIAKPTRRLQFGLSHRRGASFDFSARNDAPSFTGYTRDGRFRMPHVTTLGTAFRIAATSLVAVDYSRVQYSRLADNFVDVFFNPAEDDPADDFAADFLADNGNELHVGFEHQLLNVRWTPAIRVGTWYDPAHAVKARSATNPDNLIFRPGSDVWHFTLGGGVVVGRAEVSFGADFSDRGNIGSGSLVFRF